MSHPSHLTLSVPKSFGRKVPKAVAPPKYSARASSTGRSSGRRRKAPKEPKPKEPVTIAQTLSAPQTAKAVSWRASLDQTEKAILGAAGLTGRRAAKRVFLKTVQRLVGKTPRTQVLRAMAQGGRAGAIGAGTGVVTMAVLAGLAAYFITKSIIDKKARTKEARAANAYQLAKAYRLMRIAAEEKQGYPLNETQLKMAAEAFKTAMFKLGFETDAEGKLQFGSL